MAHTRQHLLGGGDDILPVLGGGLVHRDAHHLVLGSVVVGHDDEVAVHLVDDPVIVVEVVHHLHKLGVFLVQILKIQTIARC